MIRQVGSKPVSPEVRRNFTVRMGRPKVEPCGVNQHGDHEGGKNDTDETPPDANSVNARTTRNHASGTTMTMHGMKSAGMEFFSHRGSHDRYFR